LAAGARQSYAASRPLVFGLSSPGLDGRKRSSTRPESRRNVAELAKKGKSKKKRFAAIRCNWLPFAAISGGQNRQIGRFAAIRRNPHSYFSLQIFQDCRLLREKAQVVRRRD
jgi:hypothetical protein